MTQQFETIAAELYALAPMEFVTTRDIRAADARKAGNRDLAVAIKKLRRPTTGAWLVNLLVRVRSDLVGELLDLGPALSRAQGELAGQTLRRLSERRRQLVQALSDEGQQLARDAGQTISDALQDEVQRTFEAAVADPALADVLRMGRLTSGLRYTGLGTLDHVGTVPSTEPPEPVSSVTKRPTTTRERDRVQSDQARVRAADQALRQARAAAQEARRDADEQERVLSEAVAERERVRQEVGAVEEQLRQLKTAEIEIASTVLAARQNRDVARRAARAANSRVAKAEGEVSSLNG